ncbi:Uncharacterised protein [uncultured archaeon]|nr:Uncharacterised protein [uncultured archaeon]
MKPYCVIAGFLLIKVVFWLVEYLLIAALPKKCLGFYNSYFLFLRVGEDRFSGLRDFVPTMHDVSIKTGVPLEFLLVLAWAEARSGKSSVMPIPVRVEEVVPLGFTGSPDDLRAPFHNFYWVAELLKSRGVTRNSGLRELVRAYKGMCSKEYWKEIDNCLRYLRHN